MMLKQNLEKKKSDHEYYLGKMYPGFLVQTKGRISELSLKKFAESKMKPFLFLCLPKTDGAEQDVLWQIISPSHGEFLILNT